MIANNFQMAVRGGIMVVTMVAIPLLAIFGKQIPELIQGIYRGNTKADQWQARPTQPGAALANNSTANGLAAQQSRPDLQSAPAFQPNAVGSLNPANSSAPKFEPPALATNAFQSAQPLQLSPAINNSPSNYTLNPARSNNLASNNLGQALPPSTLRDSAVSPAANHTAPAADLNGTAFQQGQQRLRDLGVHFFRLETTGEATERYRAECELRTATNAPAMKFSSINDDPLAALNDIIGQVERTRGGRGPELQAQRGMLR